MMLVLEFLEPLSSRHVLLLNLQSLCLFPLVIGVHGFGTSSAHSPLSHESLYLFLSSTLLYRFLSLFRLWSMNRVAA